MSLRSAATALLVLAVFVVAQWSDLIMITYYNATPVKMCSIDRPNYCVYVIKTNFTSYNPNTTSIFWMYIDSSGTWAYGGSLPNTALLQALYYNNQRQQGPLTIEVPRSGYIYSGSTFYVDGRAPDALTVCGRRYSYIAPVSKGSHRLTEFYPNIYFLDPATCVSYPVVALSWLDVKNITAPWALVYIMHMPTGRKVISAAVINGTRHVYSANIVSYYFWPVGRGVYVGNGTYLPTIATSTSNTLINFLWYGPVPQENYSSLLYTSRAVWVYTIGADKSDGVVYIKQPVPLAADFAYISEDGAAGYVKFDSIYRNVAAGQPIVAYMRRYSVVEVALSDGQYQYGARTVACPAYAAYERSGPSPPPVRPFRLDIAKQLELCNNRTGTLYVALYVDGMYYYNFIDRLEPGRCRTVWFDGTRSSSDIVYLFYNSTVTLCRQAAAVRGALFSVRGLAPWYRYYVMSNNTVKQGPPISPDADYYSAWLDVAKFLAQQYNATLNALLNALKQQYNATQDATQALQSFIASQPQITGTVKVDSATSTWLRTTLSELRKWKTVGSSASFGAVALPAVPTAVAPAAAAAVAVAWAASRRDDDVATTAAIAGIALTLFGILMTLIYGTSSLTLVALGIIVAAAAAAWKKI